MKDVQKHQTAQKYKLIFFLGVSFGEQKAPAGAPPRSTELLRKWRPQNLVFYEKLIKVDKID